MFLSVMFEVDSLLERVSRKVPSQSVLWGFLANFPDQRNFCQKTATRKIQKAAIKNLGKVYGSFTGLTRSATRSARRTIALQKDAVASQVS